VSFASRNFVCRSAPENQKTIGDDLCCAQTVIRQRISKEQIMASQKRPFTDLLRKPIYLDDAERRWLWPTLALPPDKDDLTAYVRGEHRKHSAGEYVRGDVYAFDIFGL